GSAMRSQGATATVPHASHEPAHAIVTVTDAKGPLAGAIVRFAGPDNDVTTATTGPDGSARTDLVAGKWKSGGSAAGHEPAAEPIRDVHANEAITIALKLELGGRSLTGIVKDATGGPIAGARVDAAKLGSLARPADAIATTLTGADGRYKLTT